MFICDKCLKEGYTNTQSIFRSFGRCEFCKNEFWCNEIKHSSLVPKTSVNSIIEEELRQFELFDLDKQVEFIQRNYDEIKKMPEGEVIMERSLKRIEERKNEILNSNS